jgi:hypothetical protein
VADHRNERQGWVTGWDWRCVQEGAAVEVEPSPLHGPPCAKKHTKIPLLNHTAHCFVLSIVGQVFSNCDEHAGWHFCGTPDDSGYISGGHKKSYKSGDVSPLRWVVRDGRAPIRNNSNDEVGDYTPKCHFLSARCGISRGRIDLKLPMQFRSRARAALAGDCRECRLST